MSVVHGKLVLYNVHDMIHSHQLHSHKLWPAHLPCVPTGMNIGVWHTPWRSVSRDARARPCCASTCSKRGD